MLDLAALLQALFIRPSFRMTPGQEIAGRRKVLRYLLLPSGDDADFGLSFGLLDITEKLEVLARSFLSSSPHPFLERT